MSEHRDEWCDCAECIDAVASDLREQDRDRKAASDEAARREEMHRAILRRSGVRWLDDRDFRAAVERQDIRRRSARGLP